MVASVSRLCVEHRWPHLQLDCESETSAMRQCDTNFRLALKGACEPQAEGAALMVLVRRSRGCPKDDEGQAKERSRASRTKVPK